MPLPARGSSRHALTRVAVCVLLVTAVACPDPAEPERSTPTAQAGARRGGTLRVLLAGDVDSLDPHGAARPSSWFFARALHRGLFAFPDEPVPDGARPVPDLAERVPPAGRTLTVRLRADARFADGRRVTPGDVVASLQRLKRTGRGIARALRDVRAGALPDRRVRFTGGGADLPWILAHPQAAILPAVTPAWGRVRPQQVTGAGPYRVASYALERRIVLERNDAWRAEDDPVRPANVDRLDVRIGLSPRAMIAAVRAGRADLIADPGPPDLARPAIPPGRSSVVSAGCLRSLFLNVDVAPFGNRDARRAVAAAVRRARIPGVGSISPQALRILPPTVTGHRGEAVIEESVQGARRALRRAGRPRGFTTTLVVADAARDRAEARAIRDALARARIRVRIRTVHPANLHPDHYENPGARTPMGVATWCADWPGLAGRSMLRPLAASNAPRTTRYSGMRSERVDDLLNRAGGSAGRWAAADRAVTASAAIVPLVWVNEVSLLGEQVRGFGASPMFPRGDPTALWLAGD